MTLQKIEFRKMENSEQFKKFRPQLEDFRIPDTTSGTRRPYFDVGEYLPKLQEGEIEFVRINLASTTGDVFSIRIRQERNKFIINVVDEYETDFIEYESEYNQIPSQEDLLDIITSMNNEEDSQPYWLAIFEQNGFSSIEQIMDFFQIDSKIYPNLNELFVEYLNENGFKREGNEDDSDAQTYELIAELIKNNKIKSDWDSLIGTICFNIWHKTKHWYLENNDIRFIDVSFICALNLFQKWNKIYLSNKFILKEISKDASPFVVAEYEKIEGNIVKLKEFISVIKESGFGEKETSKHFISLFAADLLNSSKFKDEAINPLDYFQTGVEVLCLFVMKIREMDKAFFQDLLDIGDFETIVEEIIQDINSLNETEV